ncbi:MAG: hypothetical protein ACRC7G_15180 [Beijerinckiaceae bacterium]
MVDLLIRDLDPGIEMELRRRAKSSGRTLSLEAQTLMSHGMIVRDNRKGLGTEIRNMLPADCRVDLDIRRDEIERPPPDFS